ncbi:hypothetical protein pb186bvf_005007 [Paramecium bursaria]
MNFQVKELHKFQPLVKPSFDLDMFELDKIHFEMILDQEERSLSTTLNASYKKHSKVFIQNFTTSINKQTRH